MPTRATPPAAFAFALTLALPACRAAPSAEARDDAGPPGATAGACTDVLFGRPTEQTGLTDAQCQPRCSGCGAEPFESPVYDDDAIAELRAWTLLDPPAALAADPYADATPEPPGPDEVCAVVRDGARAYRLMGYPSAEAAKAAGATPTHYGRCGLCSPLADLAVYLAHPDLTAPVRKCGLEGASDAAKQLACLEALGFTRPCAQIWSYNTDHTRGACLQPCVAALGKPYHLEDGRLNACLQCDEDRSGPVFKAVAGRTRRNTGVANAMCRPCSEVRPLLHRY